MTNSMFLMQLRLINCEKNPWSSSSKFTLKSKQKLPIISWNMYLFWIIYYIRACNIVIEWPGGYIKTAKTGNFSKSREILRFSEDFLTEIILSWKISVKKRPFFCRNTPPWWEEKISKCNKIEHTWWAKC